MNAIMVYAGLTALLALGLSLNISRLRMKLKISMGDGGNKAMLGAIRAHGNLMEYAPLVLILLMIVGGSRHSDQDAMHVIFGMFMVGRICSSLGLTFAHYGARVVGVLLTWLTLLVLGGFSLLIAFDS